MKNSCGVRGFIFFANKKPSTKIGDGFVVGTYFFSPAGKVFVPCRNCRYCRYCRAWAGGKPLWFVRSGEWGGRGCGAHIDLFTCLIVNMAFATTQWINILHIFQANIHKNIKFSCKFCMIWIGGRDLPDFQLEY